MSIRVDVRLAPGVEAALVAIPGKLDALTAILDELVGGGDDSAALAALNEELRAKTAELSQAIQPATPTGG